jgi:hypothetical protein
MSKPEALGAIVDVRHRTGAHDTVFALGMFNPLMVEREHRISYVSHDQLLVLYPVERRDTTCLTRARLKIYP